MSQFSTELLNWYSKNNHEMPWRGESDIYKIWLSEVMLQQTQIKTVIHYYLKWINKFPTIEDVANASEHDVLKLWEGLGYYSRARNFRKASIEVLNKYNGNIPESYDKFITLPSVGEYIASAVLSIARNKPYPVIDANVKRVLSRLLCINHNSSMELSKIKSYLADKISQKSPGDFNQALMDLGRNVCIPKSPHCKTCPIQLFCKAHGDNFVDKYPIILKKRTTPHYNVGVGVIWKDDSIFINKRKSNGHLGGLWEFPGGKVNGEESLESCVQREIEEELSAKVIVGSKIGTVKHTYSHFSITMSAYNCKIKTGNLKTNNNEEYKWIHPTELQHFAFPKANHKLFPYLSQENPF